MWSSSRGFEVETTFLLWKEVLTYFPFLQASHSLSFLNLSFGRPITKSFLIRWFKWCILMCAVLQCHNHESSILLTKQLSSWKTCLLIQHIDVTYSLTNVDNLIRYGFTYKASISIKFNLEIFITKLTNAKKIML